MNRSSRLRQHGERAEREQRAAHDPTAGRGLRGGAGGGRGRKGLRCRSASGRVHAGGLSSDIFALPLGVVALGRRFGGHEVVFYALQTFDQRFCAGAPMPATASASVSARGFAFRRGSAAPSPRDTAARRAGRRMAAPLDPAAPPCGRSARNVIGWISRIRRASLASCLRCATGVAMARHWACVRPSFWTRRSKLRRSRRATSLTKKPSLRSGSNYHWPSSRHHGNNKHAYYKHG